MQRVHRTRQLLSCLVLISLSLSISLSFSLFALSGVLSLSRFLLRVAMRRIQHPRRMRARGLTNRVDLVGKSLSLSLSRSFSLSLSPPLSVSLSLYLSLSPSLTTAICEQENDRGES